MGWFSNRLRRGLTNRAYDQITREIGSAGTGSAIYAVAVAAAVYPDAIYGSEQWDQFNSMLRDPVVNPSTAAKISESWVDHHQISWDACVSRLYGCDPRDLIETSDGGSSSSQPPTTPTRVDPSKMNTEDGRQMAGQLNRNLETSETELYRLTQVLNEYLFYTRDFQLDLAEAAIVWAMAALASHERREECKSSLHAICDIMYASTEDAKKTLSESERQQIVVAANAVEQHLIAGVGDVLRASAKKLASFEKDHILRIAAEMLHQVRARHLEHAPIRLLPNMIAHCFIMCVAIDSFELGVDSEADLIEPIGNVIKSSSEISTAVHALIKSGDLVVENGMIVNPKTDGNDQ